MGTRGWSTSINPSEAGNGWPCLMRIGSRKPGGIGAAPPLPTAKPGPSYGCSGSRRGFAWRYSSAWDDSAATTTDPPCLSPAEPQPPNNTYQGGGDQVRAEGSNKPPYIPTQLVTCAIACFVGSGIGRCSQWNKHREHGQTFKCLFHEAPLLSTLIKRSLHGAAFPCAAHAISHTRISDTSLSTSSGLAT